VQVGIGEFAWTANGSALAPNRAHMAMWALVSAPLIVGLDVRPAVAPAPELLALITHPVLLRINEAWAGAAGDFVRSGDGPSANYTELWAKPLAAGEAAVAVLGRAEDGPPSSLRFTWAEIPGLPAVGPSGFCVVQDVWAGTNKTVGNGGMEALVDPRDVSLFVIGSCTTG